MGLGTDDAGRRYAAHSGGAIGGRSALVVYLDESLSVAALANSEGERLVGPALELARSLVEETTDEARPTCQCYSACDRAPASGRANRSAFRS